MSDNYDFLKKIVKDKETRYTGLENKILSKFLPYKFSKTKIDTNNKSSMFEANYVIFDFLVKQDYSCAKRFQGFVDYYKEKISPFINGVGLEFELKDNSDSIENFYELKMKSFEALKRTTDALELNGKKIIRTEDIYEHKDGVFSFSYLTNTLNLFRDAGLKGPLILNGSFIDSVNPSDVDLKYVDENLSLEKYGENMEFSFKMGEQRPFPVTFMSIPEEYLNSFIKSDPNNHFNPEMPDKSLLLQGTYEFEDIEKSSKDKLKVIAAARKALVLRAALRDVDAHKIPARLRSRMNDPYYIAKLLGDVFNEKLTVEKYKEEHLKQKALEEYLISANISMIKILEHFEKKLENYEI